MRRRNRARPVGQRAARRCCRNACGWRLSAPGAGVMDLSGHDASVVNPLLGTRALGRQPSRCGRAGGRALPTSTAASVLLCRRRAGAGSTTPSPRRTPSYLEVPGELAGIHAPGVAAPGPSAASARDSGGERQRDRRARPQASVHDVTLDHFTRAVHGDGRPVVDGRDAVNACVSAWPFSSQRDRPTSVAESGTEPRAISAADLVGALICVILARMNRSTGSPRCSRRRRTPRHRW